MLVVRLEKRDSYTGFVLKSTNRCSGIAALAPSFDMDPSVDKCHPAGTAGVGTGFAPAVATGTAETNGNPAVIDIAAGTGTGAGAETGTAAVGIAQVGIAPAEIPEGTAGSAAEEIQH